MRQFYKLINEEPKIYWSKDFIGQLFRFLNEAREKTSNPEVIARIDELTIYIGYLDKFYRWQEGSIEISELMKFLWKANNTTKIFESDWIWRYLPERYRIKVPEDKNEWKTEEKFTHEEIVEINKKDVIENHVGNISPVKFSKNLVPAGIQKKDSLRPGYRTGTVFYLYAEEDGNLPVFILNPDTEWFLYDSKGKLVEKGHHLREINLLKLIFKQKVRVYTDLNHRGWWTGNTAQR